MSFLRFTNLNNLCRILLLITAAVEDSDLESFSRISLFSSFLEGWGVGQGPVGVDMSVGIGTVKHYGYWGGGVGTLTHVLVGHHNLLGQGLHRQVHCRRSSLYI